MTNTATVRGRAFRPAALAGEAAMALFSSFSLSADFVGTRIEWSARARDVGARSPKGAARAYARKHGIAVIIRADDSAACFALDHESGKVREWVHPASNMEWVA